MANISKIVIAAAVLAGFAAPSAFAQQATGEMAQKLIARFNAADKNHDGKLTLEEAKAGMPLVARNFDKIDIAHTGSITLEQIAAFAQQQQAGRTPGGK
jgi:hypothetical protein